jgi:alpha-amylase
LRLPELHSRCSELSNVSTRTSSYLQHANLSTTSYFPLLRAFESPYGDIFKLAETIDEMQVSCKDVSLVGAFSENHDNPRFPRKSDNVILAKNIIAFTILAGGIPIIYQGQEQHYRGSGDGNDPYNRESLWGSGYDQSHELYKHIAHLNKIRRTAITKDASFLSARAEVVFTDSHRIAIKRANLLVILANGGSGGGNMSTSVRSQYGPGSLAIEMSTCKKQTVGARGIINVSIEDGLPKIFYPSGGTNLVC